MITSGIARDSIEPLVFATLSALTPFDIERSLHDQRIEPIPFDEPTNLAVLTFDTFTAKSAYQISTQYRRRGIPVVAGGIHPTLCSQEALQFVDSVVIGDAEQVWQEVVQDARQGTLKHVYEKPFSPLNGIRFDRSIFQGKRYLPVELVQFGRGCRFACDFCSVHAFYRNTVRTRPVSEVIAEIRGIGKKLIIFTDDNLFVDIERAEKLFLSLKELDVKWGCQVSLDIARNRKLVEMMSRSGCIVVTIGFESLIADNLKQMKKFNNLAYANYLESVHIFREYGIMIYGAFIFGYDYDTLDSFKISVDFAIKARLFTANMSTLAPFFGTPLYKRLKAEGRLINDPWWLHPEFRFGQAYFRPARMTPLQLEEGCYWARREFNKNTSIIYRACDIHANLGSLKKASIYFMVNMLTRKEIRRKRYQPLGDATKTLLI